MTIFTDAATITTTTGISGTGIESSVDSATIGTTTTLLSVESGPYNDSNTPAIVTQITTGELEYVHPTGYWGPFDTDDGVL